LDDLRELLLQDLVVLDVQGLAVLLVVPLLLLVHEGVPEEAGAVVERLAGLLHVLLAHLEEAVPRRGVPTEVLRDLVAFAGQTGGLEEVAAVAETLRPDVEAGADDLAVGRGALLVLPVEPAVLDVFDAVVAQVDEGVRDLGDRAEPALLDRDDVAET